MIGSNAAGRRVLGLSAVWRVQANKQYQDFMERELDAARSPTGYIVTLNDLPLIRISKLQTEVSTSMAEAEYSSLASGM